MGEHGTTWIDEQVFVDRPGEWLADRVRGKRVGVFGLDYVMPVRDFTRARRGRRARLVGRRVRPCARRQERVRARVGARERPDQRRRLLDVRRGVRARPHGARGARAVRGALRRRSGCGRKTMDMVLVGENGSALPEFKVAGARPFGATDMVLPSLEVAGPGRPLGRGLARDLPRRAERRVAADDGGVRGVLRGGARRAARRRDRARRAPRRLEGLPRPRLHARPCHRPLDRDDDDRVPEDRRGRRDRARARTWSSRCTRTRSPPTAARASTCRTRGSSPPTAAFRSPTPAADLRRDRVEAVSDDEFAEPLLPGEGDSDYERYLRTDELLALQKAPDEWAHRDELLFQTVHQSSELWLKLAWPRSRRRRGWSRRGELGGAIRLLRRANHCLKLVTEALDMLEHMSPWEYQEIRKVLGHGSGFDSPGFREMHEATPALGDAFRRGCAAQRGLTLLERLRPRPRARGPLPARRGADRVGRADRHLARPPLHGRRARDRRRGRRHPGHAGRGARAADPPPLLPGSVGAAERADCAVADAAAVGSSELAVPRTRLRQLRRHRLGAGVLRQGLERGGGARDHGRGLGRGDPLVRHRGRLRRRSQRVVHRPLARRPAAGGPARDDEGLQPGHGRPGRPRSRRRPDQAQRRGQPRAARRRSRSTSTSRTTPTRTRRSPSRSARSRRSSPRARSAPGASATTTRTGSRRRSRHGASGGRPELVLAARPRRRGGRCCRSAPSTGSPTCRTARSRAAGSRASTRAAPASRRARG